MQIQQQQLQNLAQQKLYHYSRSIRNYQRKKIIQNKRQHKKILSKIHINFSQQPFTQSNIKQLINLASKTNNISQILQIYALISAYQYLNNQILQTQMFQLAIKELQFHQKQSIWIICNFLNSQKHFFYKQKLVLFPQVILKINDSVLKDWAICSYYLKSQNKSNYQSYILNVHEEEIFRYLIKRFYIGIRGDIVKGIKQFVKLSQGCLRSTIYLTPLLIKELYNLQSLKLLILLMAKCNFLQLSKLNLNLKQILGQIKLSTNEKVQTHLIYLITLMIQNEKNEKFIYQVEENFIEKKMFWILWQKGMEFKYELGYLINQIIKNKENMQGYQKIINKILEQQFLNKQIKNALEINLEFINNNSLIIQ